MALRQFFTAGQMFIVNDESEVDDPLKEHGFKRFTEAYRLNIDNPSENKVNIMEIKGGLSLNMKMTGAIVPLPEDSTIAQTIKKKDNQIIQPSSAPPGVRAN